MSSTDGKITWQMIFEDFKLRFPSWRDIATYFKPYDYAMIEVWCLDGTKFLYNYDTKETRFIAHAREERTR